MKRTNSGQMDGWMNITGSECALFINMLINNNHKFSNLKLLYDNFFKKKFSWEIIFSGTWKGLEINS